MELIQNKITGEEVAVPVHKDDGKVVDLMEALKASIEAADNAKEGKGLKRKETSKAHRKRQANEERDTKRRKENRIR